MQHRPDATSVTAFVVFRAGSRYETEANNGASHLLEHMLFTGTERWQENEVRAVVDNAGGRFNGLTWAEQVGYWAQMPADRTAELLDWLDQVAFHATLSADKLDKEREVVFEERDGRDGWTGRALERLGLDGSYRTEIRRALFPGSSRAMSIIGEDASLDAIDAATLRAFYTRHYHAGNAAIVVVGPQPPAEVVALAQGHFGDLAAGAPVSPPDDYAPVSLGGTASVRSGVHDRCTVALAARGPALGDPALWPTAVLLAYLDIELTEGLRYARGLTYGVTTRNVAMSDGGEVGIESETDCKNVDAVAAAFNAVVDAVRDGSVDAARLERARRREAGTWAIAVEDSRARAEWIARQLVLDAPFANAGRHVAVAAVTADDIVTAARTWFAEDKRGVWVQRPVLTVAQAWAGGVGLLVLVLGAVVARWGRRRR